MVRKDRCRICNNDRCYADKLEIKSHVKTLKCHRFPKDKAKRKWWQTLVNEVRKNFIASDESRICSNHFANRKTPQPNIITDYPGQQTVSFSFLWLCFFFCFFCCCFFRPENFTYQPSAILISPLIKRKTMIQ